MALVKRLIAPYGATGRTVEVIYERASDGYPCDHTDGEFRAVPANKYIPHVESVAVPQTYRRDESRAVWVNGRYYRWAYDNVGGVRTLIGVSEIYVYGDVIVSPAEYAASILSALNAGLDVAVSTRSSFDASADQVIVGTMASGAIASIWAALTSALTVAGSVGKRIADYLDAAISSRAVASDIHTAVGSGLIRSTQAVDGEPYDLWQGSVEVVTMYDATRSFTGAACVYVLVAADGTEVVNRAATVVDDHTLAITLTANETAAVLAGTHEFWADGTVVLHGPVVVKRTVKS